MHVVPVKEVPRVAAAELRMQLNRLLQLEKVVGNLAQNVFDNMPANDLATLQEFDRLSQSIDSLVKYLEHVAMAISTDLLVDTGPAIEAVPMRDMADRMAGAEPGPGDGHNRVDLF